MFRDQVDFYFDPGSGGGLAQTLTLGAGTQFEVDTFANIAASSPDYLPPGGNAIITILPKQYILLDKAFILNLIAPVKDFTLANVPGVITCPLQITDNATAVDIDISKSPRKAWARATPGKVVSKPGDLSGAGALVNNFIAFMQNLIAKYTKLRDRRTALILQDLLDQFLGGILSITDVLARLQKLFIVT